MVKVVYPADGKTYTATVVRVRTKDVVVRWQDSDGGGEEAVPMSAIKQDRDKPSTLALPPSAGDDAAYHDYYQGSRSHPENQKNHRDNLFNRRRVLRSWAIHCAYRNDLVRASNYSAYRIYNKQADKFLTPFEESDFQILVKHEVALIPVKPLVSIEKEPIYQPGTLRKLTWWWMGKHRTSWLRDYMKKNAGLVPKKWRAAVPVLYRVMMLSDRQLADLKGGKPLTLNDYSSWAPDLASVKRFANLSYFQNRRGGNVVVFKIKPNPDHIVIHLTKFFASPEVKSVADLIEYGGFVDSVFQMLLRLTKRQVFEPGQSVEETIMSSFDLKFGDVHSMVKAEGKDQ